MTDKMKIALILKENKIRLAKKYNLTSIGIFGSFAREDFNENSDIDILVDYEKPMGIEFIDLANELEILLKRSVDLVSRNGVKPKYFIEIQKDLFYV
ncbi:MAG: nucleotidyltransferase family protein [Bacteroidetes bacterium]|nr:nucleotidyltransferase family protein [Bacteroidota bacterium]MBT3747416.1 nucleotidyltransferase family protein [Bacteroidota bacterium]MBT4409809.1 nucleotidyltransferase family protein [Bacteroidota bacterium]MBT7466171.1 nucleotidyltransferase family protein [Bacteroidota bacterium]